jgi:predicted HicB family RNase H-like nuclease
MTMAKPKTHGRLADGTPITDATVEALADEAERGYDVGAMLRRRTGRPSMGEAPASVESVRLDPDLKRDLILRAATEGISVSEVIRRALRDYVKAS